MQSTKTATTIEKVNWEEPKETPPSLMSTVCSVIMAKPVSRATAAKRDPAGAAQRHGLAAGCGRSSTACGRSQPSSRKVAPASRLMPPIQSEHGHQPEARHQPVAGGQRPGEGAGGVEGVDQRVKARGVLQRTRQGLGQDRDGAAHQHGRRQHQQRGEQHVEGKAQARAAVRDPEGEGLHGGEQPGKDEGEEADAGLDGAVDAEQGGGAAGLLQRARPAGASGRQTRSSPAPGRPGTGPARRRWPRCASPAAWPGSAAR